MRRPGRALTVVLSLLLPLTVLVSGLAPSQAAPERRDDWSGLAFDACEAPSQRAMDAWWLFSPYSGVGIYLGGAHRACPQPHLTPRWVQRQTERGWRMLPIWVGPQAACTSYDHRISSRPGAAGRYPGAHAQGLRAAKGAVAAARRLGIAKGTTLWYDLEFFPLREARCRQSALRLLSAWTVGVRRAGYRSGVYSSVSAAIDALDTAAGHYRRPDRIWFAWANGRADSHIDREWVRADWKRFQRVHQYRLDHVAEYGGVRLAIDSNYVRLGKRPPGVHEPADCGKSANRRHYPVVKLGHRGSRVSVVRCLLESGAGPTSYDGQLRREIQQFQRARGIPATGRVSKRTWTALLTDGSREIVKRGSTGTHVRRLQRALNAALVQGPAITGYFGPGTTDAVKRYQDRVGLAETGVVTPRTWRALAQGRVGVDEHRAKRDDRRDKHAAGKRGKQAGKDKRLGKHKGKHRVKKGAKRRTKHGDNHRITRHDVRHGEHDGRRHRHRPPAGG